MCLKFRVQFSEFFALLSVFFIRSSTCRDFGTDPNLVRCSVSRGEQKTRDRMVEGQGLFVSVDGTTGTTGVGSSSYAHRPGRGSDSFGAVFRERTGRADSMEGLDVADAAGKVGRHVCSNPRARKNGNGERGSVQRRISVRDVDEALKIKSGEPRKVT